MYFTARGSQCIDSGYLDQGITLLTDALHCSPPGTRSYSIASAVLAYAYQQKGEEYLSEEFLIRSAISDIEAVVKENNSIRTLASMMYENGEIDRANRYVKESLANANTYNARLRNLQTSKMLPIIDSAYAKAIELQRERLTLLLILISSLSIGQIGRAHV